MKAWIDYLKAVALAGFGLLLVSTAAFVTFGLHSLNAGSLIGIMAAYLIGVPATLAGIRRLVAIWREE